MLESQISGTVAYVSQAIKGEQLHCPKGLCNVTRFAHRNVAENDTVWSNEPSLPCRKEILTD